MHLVHDLPYSYTRILEMKTYLGFSLTIGKDNSDSEVTTKQVAADVIFVPHGNPEISSVCDRVSPFRRYELKDAELLSRLTIVSREAKKKQRLLSELFTCTTTKKLENAQAKPP